MAVQIANPAVVAKIEKLARTTKLSKTAAVEKAVDAMLAVQPAAGETIREQMDRILAQIDKLPRVEHPIEPLEWDEFGLPK